VLPLLLAALALPPFTTAPKSSPASGPQAEAYSVQAACHPGYDRFVVRARSGRPGYGVRAVSRIVADPSGNPVPLLGSRRIRVVLHDTRGHTASGANLLRRTLTPRCPNLRQVKVVGDFEGVVTFGLGLARQTGFRIFRLRAPTRVVVDVASDP
jgi:hypothetical protein